MAEPLSVTGGISAAIKILSLAAQSFLAIKGNIKEYRAVGRHLLAHQEDFQLSKARLHSWCDAWRLRSRNQTSTGVRLWGLEGWEAIERKLSEIDELCADLIEFLKEFNNDKEIEDYLQKLNEHWEKAKRSTRNKLVKRTPPGPQAKSKFLALVPEDRLDKFQRRKDLQKAIAEATGIRQKLDLLTGKSEKAGKKTTTLKECLDILDTISWDLFCSRYPEVDRGASVNKRLEAVQNRYQILEHAKKLRNAAKILYQTCSSRHIDDTRLTIELVKPEDLECETSTYRLIYEAASQSCQEFTVQALQDKPPDICYNTFADACEAALDNVTHFMAPLGVDKTQYYALQNHQKAGSTSRTNTRRLAWRYRRETDSGSMASIPCSAPLGVIIFTCRVLFAPTGNVMALSIEQCEPQSITRR
jgi:hypothetical protein